MTLVLRQCGTALLPVRSNDEQCGWKVQPMRSQLENMETTR